MDKCVTDNDQILTIAQAAHFLGVSAATLRRWDDTGKYIARRHPMSNYRIYLLRDLEKLKRQILGTSARKG